MANVNEELFSEEIATNSLPVDLQEEMKEAVDEAKKFPSENIERLLQVKSDFRHMMRTL